MCLFTVYYLPLLQRTLNLTKSPNYFLKSSTVPYAIIDPLTTIPILLHIFYASYMECVVNTTDAELFCAALTKSC